MSEWIEWNGGECPVDDDVKLYIMLGGGDEVYTKSPQTWLWEYYDADSSIVAYKLADDSAEANNVSDNKNSKYDKEIKGVTVDVYDVLKAFDVRCPALQHLIKKALQCGNRGHKTALEDYDDIIASAIRAKELNDD